MKLFCAFLGVCLLAGPAVADDFSLASVRVLPKAGAENLLAGARITGSNDSATNGFVELARLADAPVAGQWLELPVKAPKVYRYIKIEAAAGKQIAIAEIEFHSGEKKLAGKPFGTQVPKGSPDVPENAFDAKPETAFAPTLDNAYVGIDLGAECQAPAPRFSPKPGVQAGPAKVRCDTWPTGATIYYTTDGSVPSAQSQAYSQPIDVSKTTSLAAISTMKGRADSKITVVTYLFGQSAADTKPLRTYHIGNSLTDTVDGYLEPLVLSAGRPYEFLRKTIPGCGLEGNWQSNGKGFGAADYEKVLGGGVDHLFLQVFPNPPGIPRDTDAGVNFMKLAQKTRPDVQVWLYAQWPALTGWQHDAHCVGAGWMTPKWFPKNPKPANWEEAMANKMEYYETILAAWNKQNTGKPAKMVPGGPALVKLKKAIEAGQIPGIADFGQASFSDNLHLSPSGRYLIALVHYACLYDESPEGKVTHAMSGLTAEQAKAYQKIAWETVKR